MNEIIPPSAPEAEQAVLGGLMLRPDKLPELGDWLTESDFHERSHRVIFRAIVELVTAGKPCDPVTMADWFQEQGISELVGGVRYIIDLANNTPSAANVTAYAEIVREKSRLRQAMDVGATLARKAATPGLQATDIAAEATQALAGLSLDTRAGGPQQIKSEAQDMLREMIERYEKQDRVTGMASPWTDLDALTAGWQPELYLIAARPNMGKTVFGFQAASFNALAGHRTVVFSLEMRKRNFVQRCVACNGHVPHENIRKPWQMEDDHWGRVTVHTEALMKSPILVDDQPRLSALQVVSRLRREHLREPVTLAVIDHLHEMKLPGKERFGELAEAARILRAGAKDLGIPVLLLAQLNRAATSRSDHRPTLTDLRGDGGLEEVADVTLFLHREDYYAKDAMPGVVELIVGKGRDMPTGQTIYLENRFDQMRLDSWTGPLPYAEAKAKPRRGFGNPSADRVAA